MRFLTVLAIFLCSSAVFSEESPQSNAAFKHPFYVGGTVGYGSTTWQGLVPSKINQNEAISISTPISVTEGGAVWGGLVGYELSPYFAMEAHYTRYPNATISFDEFSLFAFENDGIMDLHTHTETVSLLAKVMLFIPRSAVRLYSSAGVAEIHRWDDMTENRRVTPTFALGFNYNLSEHIMAELGANYTAGYGESELNPAKDYVPFLYSAFVQLAYRI